VRDCGAVFYDKGCYLSNAVVLGACGANSLRLQTGDQSGTDYVHIQDYRTGYSGFACDFVTTWNYGGTYGYTQLDFVNSSYGVVLNHTCTTVPFIFSQAHCAFLEACAGYIQAKGTWDFVGSVCAGGTSTYTGALNDSTSTQIADVVCGLITAVYF
jgi:hypothetical protein